MDRRSNNSPVRCGGAHNFREVKVKRRGAALQAAGEQSERTPLLTESAQGAAPSKAVEASATNQEALAAAPAGTDISSAGTEPPTSTEAPASSDQQPGMQR